MDNDLITVKNFFAHWIKEIDIIKYGTKNALILTTTPQEIYGYSESMLQHLPKKALKMIQNNLLYSKEKVNYSTGQDRRIHNSNIPANRTNSNISDRISKFQEQLKNKFVYRIPLKYISNIRKRNFLTKIDLKI